MQMDPALPVPLVAAETMAQNVLLIGDADTTAPALALGPLRT